MPHCPDTPKWSENFLFTLYDADADVAMAAPGTVPDKWTMWEDRVLVMLPADQGALSLRAYHHTAPERRPGGAGLEFRHEQPWRRRYLSFDGFGLLTPQSDMLDGIGRDGPVQPFAADLEVSCRASPTARRVRLVGAGPVETTVTTAKNWSR